MDSGICRSSFKTKFILTLFVFSMYWPMTIGAQGQSTKKVLFSFVDEPVYQNGELDLKWKVDTLSNISHFLIFRRNISIEKFTEIGNILGYSKIGNHTYTFQDKSLLNKGQYEYKVRTVFNNNNHSFENLIQCNVDDVKSQNEEIFKYIYADDENKVLNMRLISNITAEMYGGFYDTKGEVIQKVKSSKVNKGLNEFTFETENFSAGDYLLILKIGTENIIEKINISE